MAKKQEQSPAIFAPELNVTRYDRVSSAMIATVIGLIASVSILTATFLLNQPQDDFELVPVELVEFPGGTEQGAIDETLLVESPEDPVPDASIDEMQEEVEIEEVFETITELADVSAEQLLQQYETDAQSSGEVGSREGSGKNAFGTDGGQAGIPREQRWYIQFANQKNLDEYARQLDFFGIELGTIMSDGTLVYLSNISQPQPTVRKTRSGGSETRMYMTWQGGPLRKSDEVFFKKAGITVSATRILHFYPPQTEEMLARLEYDYAKRSAAEIRRTYFSVDSKGSGYEFRVSRQSYFQ